ncbi:hypothetical protein T11_4044 [Trichinella zimbabwensis]|uniref:Uncharacterized protein n=1 Tax=Trichinella zimbabwensis TaxID=268475 RepID=A0A0V1GMA2_9BILA|nr:hypothetical protein T11_4044 [Trichinella zimbabwensis]
MGNANFRGYLFRNYWAVWGQTLKNTIIYHYKKKVFSPKITGIDLYLWEIISELQQTYPHRS